MNGKLKRIAEQERILLEKMKRTVNKHEVFREPYSKKLKTMPQPDLNSSTTSEDTLPIDCESDYVLKPSKKRKKRDKIVDKLLPKITGIELEEAAGAELVEEVQEEREATPYRKKKKKSEKLKALELISETSQEETLKKKKKSKRKKRKLLEEGSEEAIVQQPEIDTKVKRIKLNDSYEASSSDEVDIIDRLNAERPTTGKSRKKKSKSQKKALSRDIKKASASIAEKL